MSRELLCSWLNVPATPWPPDYYALLGLSPGQEADDIEQRVLERMEKLRHYQLLHPEPVTEGMNLLAQAMISLTDPQNRQDEHKIELVPLEPDKPTELVEEIPEAPVIEVPYALPTPARRTRLAEPRLPLPAVATRPTIVDSEPAADSILIPELVDEEPLPLPLDEEEPEPVAKPRPPGKRQRRSLERRRKIYADLVRIRRVLKVWERLRTFLDDPAKTFARRTETVEFMSSLADVRPLLPTVSDLIGAANEPGSLIAALSRQQLIVEMFRSLLPSQRDNMARDCQLAHYILLERYQELRTEIQRQTAKGFCRRVWHPFWREIISHPEWVILLVAIAALVIAFVRSIPK